jgi:integration host factor subunit alpha
MVTSTSPRKTVFASLTASLKSSKDDLDKGKDVKISGFGKWMVRVKKKQKCRNPQTGIDA